MNTWKIGKAVLRWDGRRAALERDANRITVESRGGDLARGVRVRHRAVLVADRAAVLADGDTPALHAVNFEQALQAARLAGPVAALIGRERVDLHDTGSGDRIARVAGPGGGARADRAVAVGDRGFAVPFHDRVLLVAADGRSADLVIGAEFPVLAVVGERVLAAGGSTVRLAAVDPPGGVATRSTTGRIDEERVVVAGALAAVATRDHVYVVDGDAGEIHEVVPGGAVESLTIENGLVEVHSGGNRTTTIDRDGNTVT